MRCTSRWVWSDELASILFLWLAMLGAAVAFRRVEHMRMTAVVANAKPAMRAYLDLVATGRRALAGFALATTAVIRMCSTRRKATAAPSMASHRNRIDASSSGNQRLVQHIARHHAGKQG